MTPSKTYFPQSIAERMLWMANFAAQFAHYAVILGFLPADVTAVNHDNEDFQSIAATTNTCDIFKKSVIEFRVSLTEGDIGDPAPVFPIEAFAAPPNGVPAGMFERIDRLRTRILASVTYTDEIGEALGIVPSKSDGSEKHSIEDSTPRIDAEPKPGSYVNVKFVRSASDGVLIQILLDATTVWLESGRFPKSPAVLMIPRAGEGIPRNVQIRARFLDGNDPVGDWSTVTTVQTIP